LNKKLKQLSQSFKDYLSEVTVQQLLNDYNEKQFSNVRYSLDYILQYEDRICIFIRLISEPSIFVRSKNVISYDTKERLILDFSLNAQLVNIRSDTSIQGLQVANFIISECFKCKCQFVKVICHNFVAQLRIFLQSCLEEKDPYIKLFEVTFRSVNLKNNTYLTLATSTSDSIAEEIEVMKHSIGDILQDISLIKSVRVFFKDKKVSLFFITNPQEEDNITVLYTEHALDKENRETIKIWMREAYGISILPK
jgi:hypothetical protein